jgi:magnesium-transporting ATPase (P-type)
MDKKELQRPLVPDQRENDSERLLSAKQDSTYSINSEQEETTNLKDPKHESDEEGEGEDEDKAYDDYINNVTREDKQSIIGQDIAWRKIHINEHENLLEPDRVFRSNKIHTAKYTVLTFLPKNLFFQFTKLANLYFLLMMVFQTIPQISISGGLPTILLPLGFVVLTVMVKDIIEDSKRHKSDNVENSSKILCIPRPDQMRYINPEETGIFKTLKWSQIKVGQIVKVVKDQYFPADLILINSNDPQGI